MNALVVAKGGLKLKPAAPDSAQPAWVSVAAAAKAAVRGREYRRRAVPFHFDSGSGWRADGNSTQSRHGFRARRSTTGGPGGIIHYEAPGITPEGLAALAVMGGHWDGLDGWELDMTGLSGRYQVTLDISMTEVVAAICPRVRVTKPPLQSAGVGVVQDGLKKLALQLEPRKAPVETIVVDRLEKTPTPN